MSREQSESQTANKGQEEMDSWSLKRAQDFNLAFQSYGSLDFYWWQLKIYQRGARKEQFISASH